MSATPEPKAVTVQCTVCGCDWQKHLAGPRKKNPTLEDCVRVLKQELAARPRYPQVGLANSTFPMTTTVRWNGTSGNGQGWNA